MTQSIFKDSCYLQSWHPLNLEIWQHEIVRHWTHILIKCSRMQYLHCLSPLFGYDRQYDYTLGQKSGFKFQSVSAHSFLKVPVYMRSNFKAYIYLFIYPVFFFFLLILTQMQTKLCFWLSNRVNRLSWVRPTFHRCGGVALWNPHHYPPPPLSLQKPVKMWHIYTF